MAGLTFERLAARAQSFAAKTLVDRCEVRRGGGDRVYDPMTQSYVTTPGTLVWSGPCRVRPGGAGASDPEVGGQVITLRAYRATLPMDAVGLEVDDRLTVTESRDAALLTIGFRVTDPQAGSDAKFRRVLLEADLG